VNCRPSRCTRRRRGPAPFRKGTARPARAAVHADEAGPAALGAASRAGDGGWGVDLALLDPAWLRRQIGVVLRENVLLNRSVRDNVALAVPGARMTSSWNWLHGRHAPHLQADLCRVDILVRMPRQHCPRFRFRGRRPTSQIFGHAEACQQITSPAKRLLKCMCRNFSAGDRSVCRCM